jgi:asparagine synthase (glutamine-hydrolysing)
MCGIVGKLNFDGQQPVNPELVRRMMDLVSHRGPDGEGMHVSGPIGIGHRRLSIIDLNTGTQPMCNEDGTVWIVYNGEVYNFLELRADLRARGHIFKSSSDTEVIIHLYEEMGVESVKCLRGMFSFALWDERKRLLLLARDQVGIKPLYYTNTGKAFLFASEIKSLLADPSVERAIHPGGIDRFLTYHYMPGKETLFKGIYKLEPGHLLTIRGREVSKHQYWDLRFEKTPRSGRFDEAVETLRELLPRVVKDHMISDVPVGVLLSGGVDSTGVLRYAAELSDRPIQTFTVGFEGEEFADERPFARLAAQTYGSRHQDITMTAKDFHGFLPEYVWHMEEPVFEPPAVALYFVSRLARESSVKVLLSGEGGDEAFGGYQNYRNLLMLEGLKSAFGPCGGMLRFGLKALGMATRKNIGRYGDLVDLPLSQYYFSRTATPRTFFNRNKAALYRKDFASALDGERSDMPTFRLFERVDGQPPLNCMLYVDSKTWLPDDLLIKADKITMATSVELRVPLLDIRLLEFAATLPTRFKVSGWSTKRVLKAALKESVPREILMRVKTGFPLPYGRWLKKDLRDYVFDTLLGRGSALGNYFSLDALRKIVEEDQRGADRSTEIFCFLVLELWHRKFLGGISGQAHEG